MTLQHVQRGQPLRIKATDWNAIVDATRAHLREQLSTPNRAPALGHQAGVVYVKNASGGPVDRFAVLGIDKPIILPGDNADEFKRQAALSCVTPTTSHASRFVILTEPAPAGGIVRGVAAGVAIVTINVIDEAHQFAKVRNGDSTKLDSATSGGARILWKETPGSGDKWAIVRLGESPAGLVPVNLTKTGGDNGTKTSAASYTYTVTDAITGEELLTGASPAWARPKGAVNVATHGTAYHNGSTWVLYQIDETPMVGC